ncbi:MAG: nucleotidyltransferase family protein [Paracoccus sp. (in: a-proteobacteria)]|nr:nucleotidyltransferase family protein [Paracoccus sp. (in: a-proteobacteria)]
MPHPLMIFAAGRGTRMAPLTDTRPKPLIEVAGRSLLDRALDLGREAGCAPVVVNSHYLGDMVADHLAGQEVAISAEEVLLETGGGLRQALPLLGGGAVMTLNPDVLFTGPNPLATLAAAWDPARMDALFLLVSPDHAVGRIGGGDFAMDDAGRISRRGPWIYAGASICQPESLQAIEEQVFSLNLFWDGLIAQGRAFGVIHPGRWVDVGRPDCIPLAEAMLAQGPLS